MLGNIHHLVAYNGHNCLECAKALTRILSETTAPHWTAQVQSLGVGFGAFFAGLGGLKIIFDWSYQVRLKRKISGLKQRYPDSLLNKKNGYRLAKIESQNEWWLLDERMNTRYWIKNLETVAELGWRGETPEKIEKAELDKYPKGEHIDTTIL